ncbi:MAG: hypothetical protein JNM93_08180 [Bacteriovoracaceae bacterium]|nr:hypothetical protein [Bacteriovoracaceae bacterium]
MLKSLFILNLLIISTNLFSQTDYVDKQISLAYSTNLDDNIRFKSEAQTLLNKALALVSSAAPLSHYSFKPVDTFSAAKFFIQITSSDKAVKKDTHPGTIRLSTTDGDGYSVLFSQDKNAPVLIRIFWDKTLYEIRNNRPIERPDAFVRLVSALGRQIHGNLIYYRQNIKLLSSAEFADNFDLKEEIELKSKVNAFKKNKLFLENVLRNFQNDLTPKMINDMNAALEKETQMFESNNKKLCDYLL